MTTFRIILVAAGLLVLVGGAAAQKRRNQRPGPTPAPSPSATLSNPNEPSKIEEPPKRNSRPDSPSETSATTAPNYVPTHFFEFERKGFVTPRVQIEHDDSGKGKISFTREAVDEAISDPIQLSPATMKTLGEILDAMSFLDSTENYQYKNDMPQMGNNTFTLKRSGKERTVKYNWTTHPEAKRLIDEYRRIGNEFVWRFDLSLARENQPLQTPKLLTTLEFYLNSRELSDPTQLLPLLIELSTDERIPLMARNTASRLIQQIERYKKTLTRKAMQN